MERISTKSWGPWVPFQVYHGCNFTHCCGIWPLWWVKYCKKIWTILLLILQRDPGVSESLSQKRLIFSYYIEKSFTWRKQFNKFFIMCQKEGCKGVEYSNLSSKLILKHSRMTIFFYTNHIRNDHNSPTSSLKLFFSKVICKTIFKYGNKLLYNKRSD